MRLSVKILGGEGCDVDVNPEDSVESLKREVEAKLRLTKETEQKILYQGKALQDGTSLSDYDLKYGSKLNLVLKRREGASTTSRTSTSASKQTFPQEPTEFCTEAELFKSLRPHFESDHETGKVVAAFIRIFRQKLASFSLDDIERFCKLYNATEVMRF